MTMQTALKERRNSIAREVRNLLDNKPGKHWTDRDQKTYDAKIEEISRIDDQLKMIDTTSSAMLCTWIRHDFKGFTPEQMNQYYNTMGTGTGSQGGYTVASDVAGRLIDTLKDYSGVRRYAEVIKTEKGNTMPFPTSDGTSEAGELVAENATATGADPSFGTTPMPTYKYSSKVFTVPFELMMDSNIDLEQFLFDRAASRIGRITNTHFTVGTGSGQPQGFAPIATVGKTGTTGQTATVIHDDVVDLIHSVNAAYRQHPAGGVAFMMADVAFKVVRKLKDSSQRPIYLPSDGEQPETLLGYPVNVNDDCPTPAANAKSIFFGNWRIGYKVRDALEVTLFRMADSGYIKQGQIGFIAFARCGGNLVDTSAIRAYQHSAT